MVKNLIWSKELILELLCLYEMNQNLYVVKHPDYINRIKRADSFQMIVDSLKHLAPNVTIESIKRKIHSLRNQFTRDLREVEKSRKSGAGVEDIFEPKLWCFNEMLFLKNHCKTRDSISSYEEKTEQPIIDGNEIEKPGFDSLVEEDDSFTPKRKVKSSLGDYNKRLKIISARLDQKNASKSPYAWLGKQVVFEIDQMADDKIKRKTAWEIQKILRVFGEEDLAKSTQRESLSSTSQSSREENLKMQRESSVIRSQSTSTSTSEECTPKKILLHITSVKMIRPASANSDAARSPFPVDILEQSMEGVFDECDFV